MAESGEVAYIEFLPTAEAVVEADDSPDLFFLSIVPDATTEQLYFFRLYTIGKVHDGIHIGLGISGQDPIGVIDAHRLGVTEGLNQRDR